MTALKTKVKIIFFFSLTLIGNVQQQNTKKKNCACKMCAKLYYMCPLKWKKKKIAQESIK